MTAFAVFGLRTGITVMSQIVRAKSCDFLSVLIFLSLGTMIADETCSLRDSKCERYAWPISSVCFCL